MLTAGIDSLKAVLPIQQLVAFVCDFQNIFSFFFMVASGLFGEQDVFHTLEKVLWAVRE